MIRYPLLVLLFIFLSGKSHNISAQKPEDYASSEILLGLHKLNTLGSVLYLAAHPDDENTKLIAWLSKDKLMRTGYLSLTRGSGGQNLIGTEKGASLGVLRTQELLEARKIDGGTQFFTRAVDFGYSKNAKESLDKWGKDKILSDVVWVIRKFQPDVIITRFPPDSYGGHGHHIASAQLAQEAFEKAADPNVFSTQLDYVDPWQPKRLLFNASTWWNKDLPQIADTSDKYFSVDVGTYNPLLGYSHNEIAMMSRSMHRSQGFGAALQRGEKLEYLSHVTGDKTETGITGDVETSWKRVGAPEIQKQVNKIIDDFSPQRPSGSVKDLVKVYKSIQDIDDEYWKKIKSEEVKSLIAACTGLWLEANSSEHTVAFNDEFEITATALNRSEIPMKVKSMSFPSGSVDEIAKLPENENFEYKKTVKAPQINTHPYWLNDEYENIYPIADQEKIGLAVTPPKINIDFEIEILGESFIYKIPVRYKWTDIAIGELVRPLAIVPPATANIKDNVYVFAGNEKKQVDLSLKAHTANIKGEVELVVPENWKVSPEKIDFNIETKGKEKIISFMVEPPANQSVGEFHAEIKLEGETYYQGYSTVAYPHIPTQTLIPPAKAKAVKIDIKTRGNKVGYIMGPGDEIPQNLEQIGYQVEQLDPENLHITDLSDFDAIITGIRAYNTREALKYNNEHLLDYVKNGGTMVVQYNKYRGLVNEKIGPYPFKITYDRVTVEESEVSFLKKDHPILNEPNTIGMKDFDNWVQERGLYFSGEWDDRYTPLLSWSDPGEDAVNGGLLVTDYGKGAFIYTGISFFRQLPAGVPGAFRLFSNIVSYRGKGQQND